MIKHGPIVIEFGDGDIGLQFGRTEENDGVMALFNTEPGEIGRESVGEPTEGSIGTYIIFKNVKSLDCVIRNFQKLRDLMAADGKDDGSHPIKRPWNCETCKWHTQNSGCTENDSCDECPHLNDDRRCKCLTVAEGASCPYFEKLEKEDE